MTAKRVTSGCVAVERQPLGPYQANMYVISDGSSLLLVDPSDDARTAMRVLDGRTPELIVLTHRHSDHVAAARAVSEATGAPVAASRIDAGVITGAEPLPADEVEFPRCAVAQLLAEGDEVRVGKMRWRVMHTPGHTEGEICLFLDAGKTAHPERSSVLVAGDVLFEGGVGRVDFAGGDARAMRRSLRRLAELPDDTIVLTGHGETTTIKAERRRTLAQYAR